MGVILLQAYGGYSIAIALVAIMISVAGISLGIGYAADEKKLKEFGKTEICQAVISGAVIGSMAIAFSSYGPVTTLINGLTVGVNQQQCIQSFADNYAICFAYDYLIGSTTININGHTYPSLITSTMALLASVTALYVLVGTLASVKANVLILSVGLQGLSVFLGPLKDTADFLTLSAVIIVAQAAVMKFIYLTATSVILPVGITLRTFYPTRRLGGAIMATAIGLFVVLPLTYVFDAQLMDTYLSSATNQTINSTISGLSTLTANASSIENSTASSFSGNLISAINPLTYLQGVVSGFSKSASSAIEELANSVTMVLIQAFFLPTFSLVLTAISTRELARVLGSEVSFGVFDVT